MMRSMYSGISGIRAHQIKMDVVANNIANVNTVGYKSSRVTFQEVLNQTIEPAFGSDTEGSLGGVNAKQIGLGVSVGAIDVLQDPGASQVTNRGLDVAIDNDGFFMVTDGTNQFYTRAGNFYVDKSGNLVTNSGYKVCDSSGSAITGITATNVGIDEHGILSGTDDTGAKVNDIATIGIAKFTNPEGLMKVGSNMYKASANSSDPVTGNPGDSGFSTLSAGTLEMSNVDLSQEFTDMIIAQRGFQANSRVITTSNDMLQDLAGIIR